jgi:hypothetical protein
VIKRFSTFFVGFLLNKGKILGDLLSGKLRCCEIISPRIPPKNPHQFKHSKNQKVEKTESFYILHLFDMLIDLDIDYFMILCNIHSSKQKMMFNFGYERDKMEKIEF